TCHFEPGSACGDAVDLNALGQPSGDVLVYSGDTTSSANTTYGNPSCSGGTTNVKRVLHKYQVGARSASLVLETLDVDGNLDNTVVWAYLDCKNTGAELACDDNGGPGSYSKVTTPIVPARSTVFIVVAGFSAAKVGAY